MRIGNGCDQPVAALDRHVAIGRQVVRAIGQPAINAQPRRRRDQFLALGIAANRR